MRVLAVTGTILLAVILAAVLCVLAAAIAVREDERPNDRRAAIAVLSVITLFLSAGLALAVANL